MIYVLTPQAMRAADAAAISVSGEVELMRAAGRRIAEVISQAFDPRRVVAFAGPGNNGGDAFAACAAVRDFEGVENSCAIYAEQPPEPSAARRDAQERAHGAGVEVAAFPQTYEDAKAACKDATCIVAALFGTGARLPLGEPYAGAVRAINESGIPVLAVDIPSGIDALTGAVSDPAIKATVTITLGALKPGLLLDPARDCVGTLYLAEIGIPDVMLQQQPSDFATLDNTAFLDLLPRRSQHAEKRSAGAPLIIAGSRQFPGAAILCAKAAARAGAGYITVATSSDAAAAARLHLIEQVVTEIDERASVDEVVEQLLDTARHASSIGIGPGLGLDPRTGKIVRNFLRKTALPFVADASALFHLAKHLDLLDTPRALITPHAGEFARLSGKGTVRDDERVDRLREFVDRTHCTTLLKGRTTLVYDGKVMHMNTTGTSALATAGTGDVLTGIIAALLSQGLSPVDAARAAAYWHGLAGQYCSQHRNVGVTAGDLPDALAEALPGSCIDSPITYIFGSHDALSI